MKKIITIVLACLMASSFICVGVSAAAENTTKNIAKVQITSEELSKMTTEEIAYLNLENADEEAKEVILAARNKIIYTREWAADGYSGYVTDKDGNIKRVLPNFSEVFPGWDLPKLERKSNPTVQPKFINCDIDDVNAAIEAARNAENNAEQINPNGLSDWIRVGGSDAYLHEATQEQAENFAVLYTDLYNVGTSVGTYVSELTSSETCNIGYSNYTTGEPLLYFTNLSLYDTATIHNVGDMYLGIRASTYSNPGWAYFDIFGSNRYGYVK